MCYMCYNAYDIWQGDIAHKKYTKPRLNILLCAILCYIAYDFWNQETSPYKKNTLNLYVIFFSDEKKRNYFSSSPSHIYTFHQCKTWVLCATIK